LALQLVDAHSDVAVVVVVGPLAVGQVNVLEALAGRVARGDEARLAVPHT